MRKKIRQRLGQFDRSAGFLRLAEGEARADRWTAQVAVVAARPAEAAAVVAIGAGVVLGELADDLVVVAGAVDEEARGCAAVEDFEDLRELEGELLVEDRARIRGEGR